jgi:DNA sulfur modification protein DndD
MIIKKLSLNNFLCYYGNKTFEFSDGLNIILGHNGDGKSTLFTAFNWIFNSNLILDPSVIYSKKKYFETLEKESFEVSVECIVVQYNDEYKIVKSFNVTNDSFGSKFSSLKEEIWVKNLTTGENSIDHRTISKLSQQVFPEAFRSFSMFETETDALKIVEGEKLSDLIKNFSNARHYDKLDDVIADFADKADKQFRRESKSEKNLNDNIDDIDKKISDTKQLIKTLENRISEDELGRDSYTNRISDLFKNLTISDNLKEIDEKIEKYKVQIDLARRENKSRYRFTDFLFDNFYILKGFEKVIDDFSGKLNYLRQEKNRVDNEERNKSAKERLELDNGTTPFPPGFPSLDVLNEILEANICKICNTNLENSSREFINRSIKLFEESKIVSKEIIQAVIFPNSFIDEFQIIERSLRLKPDIYSENRIINEIEFGVKRISENTIHIKEVSDKILELEKVKKDLLSKIPNRSENEVKNIRLEYEKNTIEKENLITKIAENKIKKEFKTAYLQELQTTRNRILSQFKATDFKKSTVEYLELISEIAKEVKDEEYKKFLNVLSERSTEYLKKINVGEITGKIELYKKNDKEVVYKSLNEDNSLRSTLEDSGALQISKPLSILFAIADLSAEHVDNESYPMIFDAPTGRFSPDREQEFFKVLKSTKKQRIVVTLRFLNVDDNNVPYVNYELFNKIEKDKAFFIKRNRPLDLKRPETINTEIEVL